MEDVHKLILIRAFMYTLTRKAILILSKEDPSTMVESTQESLL